MMADIDIIISGEKDNGLKIIAQKVKDGIRITDEECLLLFEKGSLGFVGALSNFIREKLHGDKTYFNRNFHRPNA
jgi:aminodeoxyfutalosine synthase